MPSSLSEAIRSPLGLKVRQVRRLRCPSPVFTKVPSGFQSLMVLSLHEAIRSPWGLKTTSSPSMVITELSLGLPEIDCVVGIAAQSN